MAAAGIIDILFNAAGGGVVGSLLHLGTSWYDTWRKKQEADIQIRLMEAQSASAEKSAAWAAFTASQNASAGPFTIPPGTSPLVANIFVLVEAVNRGTRSLLCWLGVCLLTGVYFTATVAQQEAMQPQIQFGVWTAIFWFFGARYSKQK